MTSTSTPTTAAPVTARSVARALLTLEIASVGPLGRTLLVIGLISAAFVLGGMAEVLPIVLGITAISLANNTWTADEAHRLPLLYGSLPVRRRDVVASHYRFAALVAVGTAVVAAVLAALATVLHPGPSTPFEAAMLAFMVMAGIALSPAIVMPLRLKFGQMLGMVILMATVGIVTAGGMFLAERMSNSAVAVAAPSTPSALGTVGVLLAVNATVWAASYLICQRIYAAKDF